MLAEASKRSTMVTVDDYFLFFHLFFCCFWYSNCFLSLTSNNFVNAKVRKVLSIMTSPGSNGIL